MTQSYECREPSAGYRPPRADRLKRWLWTLLRAGVTVGAMAFVLSRVDLGETLRRMQGARVEYFLIVLAILQIGMVARARRWGFLLAAHGIHAPLRRLTQLSYTGEFFGQFLPTAFGGDVVRILAFGETRLQIAAATAILDRMMGLMMLFVMALVMPPFSQGLLPGAVVFRRRRWPARGWSAGCCCWTGGWCAC